MNKSNLCLLFSALGLMLLSTAAFAELAYIDPVTNQSIFDQVAQKFLIKAKGWHAILEGAAIRLFWTLVLISMVWTFGMMVLRKADIGDFFAEGGWGMVPTLIFGLSAVGGAVWFALKPEPRRLAGGAAAPRLGLRGDHPDPHRRQPRRASARQAR